MDHRQPLVATRTNGTRPLLLASLSSQPWPRPRSAHQVGGSLQGQGGGKRASLTREGPQESQVSSTSGSQEVQR